MASNDLNGPLSIFAAARSSVDTSRASEAVSSTLSWLLLAVGVATAAFMGYLTFVSYSPVPWMDPWFFIYQLDRGHLSVWSLLWTQHNEHRMIFPKLFYLADFYWFHAKGIFVLIAIYVVQAVHCALLVYFVRRLGGLRGAALRSAAGLILFCIFNPAKREDFINFWQITYVLPMLAITLAIMALGTQAPRSRWFSPWIATAWVAALVASFSVLSGFVIWPLLCIEAAALGLPLRTWVATACIGIAALSVNAIGFHQNSSASAAEVIHRSREVVGFFKLLVAEGWPPAASYAGVATAWIGIFLCLALVSRRIMRPSKGSELEIALSILALTGAGAAGMTAVGRFNTGFTNRYEEPVLLFWAAFGLLLFAFVSTRSAQRWMLPLQAAVVSLAIAGARPISSLAVEARAHRQSLDVAGSAYASGVNDAAATAFVSMPADWTFGELNFLKERNAALYGDRPLSLIGAQLPDVYRIVPNGCAGKLKGTDFIDDSKWRGLTIRGSAWKTLDGNPLSWLVIADDTGKIVGAGANDSAIRDPGASKKITWSAFAPVPPEQRRFFIYGVVSDKEVCVIRGLPPITGVPELAEPPESAQALTQVWSPEKGVPRVVGGIGTIRDGLLAIRSDDGDTQAYFDTGTDLKQFAALLIKARFERADTVELFFGRQIDGRGISGSVSATGQWVLVRANVGLNPYWSKEATTAFRFDPTGARGPGAVTYIAGIWGSKAAAPADADFFETYRVPPELVSH